MEKRKKASITRNIFISTLKASLLVNLTFVIGSFVDGVFIGNFLGVEAAAAYGMVWPVTFIYLIIILIISGGACIVYMRLVGEGNIKEANTFRNHEPKKSKLLLTLWEKNYLP